MELNLSSINWYAVGACLVFGQIFLSLWFIVLFGTSWAKEYGVADSRQHTKEIPGYTYGIQALCTLLLIIGMAVMQGALSIDTFSEGLWFGFLVVLFFSWASALPGYIFLKRWKAFFLSMGSQAVIILVISSILAIWK